MVGVTSIIVLSKACIKPRALSRIPLHKDDRFFGIDNSNNLCDDWCFDLDFDLDLDSNYDSGGEFEHPELEQPEKHEYHLEGNVYL